MADEVIKLLLQVQGQAEADKLRGSMEKLREQIVTLGRNASATDPARHAEARREFDTIAQLSARALADLPSHRALVEHFRARAAGR